MLAHPTAHPKQPSSKRVSDRMPQLRTKTHNMAWDIRIRGALGALLPLLTRRPPRCKERIAKHRTNTCPTTTPTQLTPDMGFRQAGIISPPASRPALPARL